MTPCPACRSNRDAEALHDLARDEADQALAPDAVRSFCAGIGQDIRRGLAHGEAT